MLDDVPNQFKFRRTDLPSVETVAGEAGFYNYFASGAQPPMKEGEAIEIQVPFYDDKDMNTSRLIRLPTSLPKLGKRRWKSRIDG